MTLLPVSDKSETVLVIIVKVFCFPVERLNRRRVKKKGEQNEIRERRRDNKRSRTSN